MARFTPKCSQEQFESLHRDIDRTRRTSDTVKVSRAALDALLKDHAELHATLKTGQ